MMFPPAAFTRPTKKREGEAFGAPQTPDKLLQTGFSAPYFEQRIPFTRKRPTTRFRISRAA